jgi:hypothetical protein
MTDINLIFVEFNHLMYGWLPHIHAAVSLKRKRSDPSTIATSSTQHTTPQVIEPPAGPSNNYQSMNYFADLGCV